MSRSLNLAPRSRLSEWIPYRNQGKRPAYGWDVGLRSFSEPWLDTTSPFGEALYYITVAYAQLERGILKERVRAGMERAKRQGKRLGRPSHTQDAEFLGK